MTMANYPIPIPAEGAEAPWGYLFNRCPQFGLDGLLLTLPARLVAVLAESRLLDVEAAAAERELLAACQQHHCAGMTLNATWQYWPVNVGIDGTGLPGDVLEAQRAYIAYLWTQERFFSEWLAFRRKHRDVVTRLGYPLYRLPPRLIKERHQDKAAQSFYEEFWDFTSGWALQGMAGEKYPLPPLPLGPSLTITQEIETVGGLGLFSFTPLYMRLSQNTMQPQEKVVAAQQLQSKHMQSTAWHCKCLPHGNGIAHMARCFLFTYYGTILTARYPHLLTHGRRGLFGKCISESLGADEREHQRMRRELRSAAGLRRDLGLSYP